MTAVGFKSPKHHDASGSHGLEVHESQTPYKWLHIQVHGFYKVRSKCLIVSYSAAANNKNDVRYT